MPATSQKFIRRVAALRALLVLPLLCGLGSAPAQEVYKNVGPDGKITFTDKPPAGVAAPPARSAAPASPATPAAPAGGAAQPAGQASVKGRIDPALEKSLLMLMGYESIVAEFKALCRQAQPASLARYEGAAQQWTQRHAALLARYPAVLKQLYPAPEQASLRSGVQGRTRTMMANIHSAPDASKVEWCDGHANEINAGAMDMAGKPQYARPLLDFSPKR